MNVASALFGGASEPYMGPDDYERRSLLFLFRCFDSFFDLTEVFAVSPEDLPADRLVEALRKQKLEVTVMASNRLFESPAELIPYDTVIMADVPRTSGAGVEDLVDFSDAQARMLATNVHEMGCGLVMLGGPDSFGAGGWTNTPVEEALPVDFQIKNAKVMPSGALLLVPQFTLAADTDQGLRPGFSRAAPPESSRRLFAALARHAETGGVPVRLGRFGAAMQVTLTNDGPVTFWLRVAPGRDAAPEGPRS